MFILYAFDSVWHFRKLPWCSKIHILCIASHHSAAEHRASTRIPHLILFLASVLISAQVFLTPLASWSPFSATYSSVSPCPVCLGDSHSRACLAMLSEGFRSVWPSRPNLRFLICKSILGCFVKSAYYWAELKDSATNSSTAAATLKCLY